jgi:acetylornithine deacetylase/succinyl-diaminopimelate desuccinylase-like protein
LTSSTGLSDGELARLFALLEVPSVSVDHARAADLRRAATLCAAEIERAGGQAQITQPAGAATPLVTGLVRASPSAGSAPRVLVYGHYDVQAAESPEEWMSPPFSPQIRDGYLYGRGVNDDKAQLFLLLIAVQRLAAAGSLPVDVAFLIDGEEEIGGTSAPRHAAAMDDDLAAAIVFDAPMLGPRRPALYIAARGLVYLRINIRTGTADGHSGHFGGAALNAAHVLLRALAAVTPVDGVLPAALTHGASPVDEPERESWRGLPGGLELLESAGLAAADARAVEEFHERTLAQPALDVHMLSAGGPQPKNVVVTEASATLSVRLAPGQRAADISAAVRALLLGAISSGAEVEIEERIACDPAQIDPGHPVMRRAARALGQATGLEFRHARLGGTLPLLATLAQRSVPTIFTGFHQSDDRTHAANERIALDALQTGLRAATALLTAGVQERDS